MENRRIVLNVGGEIFETHSDTLNRFPDTLLGNETKRNSYYSSTSRQHYFNRNRLFFDAILFFYQSRGVLRCPEGIPIDFFVEECEFFEIPESFINDLKPRDPDKITVEDPEESEDPASETFRARIWDLVQKPETSAAAKIFSFFDLFMILLSVLLTCIESVPSLQVDTKKFEKNPWAVSELVLNSWFLFHLCLSAFATPEILKFVKKPMTWIDMIAVVPYFVVFFISRDEIGSFAFMRIVRLARVPRMLRLSKHSERLKLASKILSSCIGAFNTILLTCATVMTLSGCLIVFFEEEGNPQFSSIPQGMYWAIITVSTVGYGELVPVSIGGKIFAGFYMLFGALTLTIPLISIVHKFEKSYRLKYGSKKYGLT